MTTRLVDLRIDEISFVDKGANPGAKILITKRRVRTEKSMLDAILAKLPEAERNAVLAAIEAAKKGAPAEPPKGDDQQQKRATAAELLKRDDLPADVRKVLEETAEREAKADEEREAVEKARKDADARIAKLEEETAQRDALEKADSIGAVPQLTRAQLAKVLRLSEKHFPKAEAELLLKHLKSVAELVKKGEPFQEIGSSAGGDEGELSAAEEIEKRAKAYVEKHPDVSIQKAKLVVTDADPQLQKRYRDERRAGAEGR